MKIDASKRGLTYVEAPAKHMGYFTLVPKRWIADGIYAVRSYHRSHFQQAIS
jgi:hypothetical protein